MAETVETNPFEQVETTTPASVHVSINSILAKLPEDDRAQANRDLNDAIQDFIANTKIQLIAISTRELTTLQERLVTEARIATENKIAEITKAAGPMNPDEMQKLVSQEYLTFTIPVQYSNDEDGVSFTEKNFVIREVPQSVEKRIMDAILKQIVPAIKKLQGIKFASGATNADKLQHAVKVVPEVFDIISEITTICLNPYNKDGMVTKEWVQQNLSSARMMGVLQAQFMANRLRDFLSGVSRVSQGM